MDREAFALFRFSFYMSLLFFYTFVNGFDYSSWLDPTFKVFFEPISFFKALRFEDFLWIKSVRIGLIWRISLVLAAFGILFPLTSLLSFLGMLIMAGVSLNFGKIHHVNHMPIVILGLLVFSFHSGKWVLRTSQLYMCLVYFASGFQKLRHAGLEWIFSDNMSNIIITRPTVTSLGLWTAEYPILCQLLAFVILFSQITAPLALISTRYARFVVPTLFMLHIGSYLTLGDHGYFFPYNLCFLVWLPWEKFVSLKHDFLRWGGALFERVPLLSRNAQIFYVKILFPLFRIVVGLRFGGKVKLELRHSVLKKTFNPFFSDIDYVAIVSPQLEHKVSEVARFLLFISKKCRVLDVPQIYWEREWNFLSQVPKEIQDQLTFFWHFRKVSWMKKEAPKNAFEGHKKKRALEISGKIIFKENIQEGTVSVNQLNLPLPEFSSSGAALCFYSPFLELVDEKKVLLCSQEEFSFLLSLLPGELNYVELSDKWTDLKRHLWIQECLLAQSHARVHGLEPKNDFTIRHLEESYEKVFKEAWPFRKIS